MHWATKARVWFEYNRIVPFVTKDAWLEMGGAGVFTDRHPDYPVTVPLLQVWMNLALGHWDESLMNLPWLLCLIALGSAFYGQLRVTRCRPGDRNRVRLSVALACRCSTFMWHWRATPTSFWALLIAPL